MDKGKSQSEMDDGQGTPYFRVYLHLFFLWATGCTNYSLLVAPSEKMVAIRGFRRSLRCVKPHPPRTNFFLTTDHLINFMLNVLW